MITEAQQQEILSYLSVKKLPVDLLIEVYDHFISQIHDLQARHNLCFNDAFQKTKDSWCNDLTPYWNGGGELENRSDLVRNFEKTMLKSVFFESVKYAGIIVLASFVLSLLFPKEIFQYLILLLIVIMVFAPIIKIIRNWKAVNLPKKHSKFTLTLYQNYVMIHLSMAYFLFKSVSDYKVFVDAFLHVSTLEWQVFGILFIYLALATICLFTWLSLNRYLVQIKKVEAFILTHQLN